MNRIDFSTFYGDCWHGIGFVGVVFTYGIRALGSTLGPWVHYARHKTISQLVKLCYLSWWHGLNGVSSSYDYFDIEWYDAPYVCHNFELTLHSFIRLLKWKVFWKKIVICIP